MSSEYADEELRKALKQQALHDLSQDDGLMPVYRADVTSKAYFEDRLNEMPLVTLWGERLARDDINFSISVNERLVLEALERFMNRLDPWLPELHGELVGDILRLTDGSMRRAIEKTGEMPSVICQSIAS